MAQTDEIHGWVSELTQVLLDEETLDTSLARVADLAVSVIPTCDSCGVTLVADERARTRTATDEVARIIDEHQYRTGEGPCLDAIREGLAVTCDCRSAEGRWPSFGPAAVGEGLRSSYSVPLRVRDRVVGALNLYSMSGDFSDEDSRIADAFASQSAVAVANAQSYQRARHMIGSLEEALRSRDVIGQAKGIIMERERCTDDQAFDVLRKVSQQTNIKLRDVAERVVMTGSWSEAGTPWRRSSRPQRSAAQR